MDGSLLDRGGEGDGAVGPLHPLVGPPLPLNCPPLPLNLYAGPAPPPPWHQSTRVIRRPWDWGKHNRGETGPSHNGVGGIYKIQAPRYPPPTPTLFALSWSLSDNRIQRLGTIQRLGYSG